MSNLIDGWFDDLSIWQIITYFVVMLVFEIVCTFLVTGVFWVVVWLFG